MTKDDIIRMAREAGLIAPSAVLQDDKTHDRAIERFAQLVAAAEREDNVKLLMRLGDSYEHADKQGSADDIYKIVDHIRARGQE